MVFLSLYLCYFFFSLRFLKENGINDLNKTKFNFYLAFKVVFFESSQFIKNHPYFSSGNISKGIQFLKVFSAVVAWSILFLESYLFYNGS